MKKTLHFYFVLCLDSSHSLADGGRPLGSFLLITANEINDILVTLGCPFECENRELTHFAYDEILGEVIESFVEVLEEEEKIFWEKEGYYLEIRKDRLLTYLRNRGKPKAPPKSSRSHVPPNDAKSDQMDLDRIFQIEEHLRKSLIGQDQAIESLLTHLRVEAAGLKRKTKPVYVVIFCGPTGVGKTECGHLLAEALHGSRDDLLKIPCQVLSEQHTLSTLLSSPPGYVGSQDRARGVRRGEGYYVKPIIEIPYTVILFDEIERAHPAIHDHLLGIMNEGEVMLRSGEKIDFSKTIIILTSNVGSKDLVKTIHGRSIGFQPPSEKRPKSEFDFPGKERKQITKEALEKTFPPEFLGRLDDIIVFRWLDPNEVGQVLDLRIEEFNWELLEHRDGPFFIKLTDAAKTFLVSEGFNPREGARRINKAVDTHIRLKVSDLLLNGRLATGDKVVFDHVKGELKVTIAPLSVIPFPISDEEGDEPEEESS